MQSECIPLLTLSLEGHLHAGIFWFLTWILLQKIRTSPSPSLHTFNLKGQFRLPLLATLGITAAMGTRAAEIGTSIHNYTKLSNQLVSDLQTVAESILTLQKQLDSLALVILQNR
jgi:hypothetical protein